jgi:hypothetical protein
VCPEKAAKAMVLKNIISMGDWKEGLRPCKWVRGLKEGHLVVKDGEFGGHVMTVRVIS